ncbi:MAG: transcription antitermination factor NusB [Candidatus Kapaibacteriota bacterium]|jgi:N utilization substance protein B
MPQSRPSESTPKATRQPITTPIVKGTRRIAREKVMQLLSAQEISEVPWRENFPYIFPYEYRIDEAETPNRLLTEQEVESLESDFIIDWDDETKQFALALLDRTEHYAEYSLELIEKFSQNWELGRLAHIDRVVLKIAIAELMSFEEIPAKVTINEAIEIVKKYSTDKSSMFVNGVLDSALAELTTLGRVTKTGRGLLDINLGKQRGEG